MTVRVMNLGGGGVGKTSLLLQWAKQQFQEDYTPTIEEMLTKTVSIGKKTYQVEMTDTAGQEEFAQMRWRYMQPSEGFLFVFSVIEPPTLHQLSDLYGDVRKAKQSKMHCVLAGNKIDLKDEAKNGFVSHEEGTEFANKMGCRYYETSAKTCHNSPELFDDLIRGVIRMQNANGSCCKIF